MDHNQEEIYSMQIRVIDLETHLVAAKIDVERRDNSLGKLHAQIEKQESEFQKLRDRAGEIQQALDDKSMCNLDYENKLRALEMDNTSLKGEIARHKEADVDWTEGLKAFIRNELHEMQDGRYCD